MTPMPLLDAFVTAKEPILNYEETIPSQNLYGGSPIAKKPGAKALGLVDDLLALMDVDEGNVVAEVGGG